MVNISMVFKYKKLFIILPYLQQVQQRLGHPKEHS